MSTCIFLAAVRSALSRADVGISDCPVSPPPSRPLLPATSRHLSFFSTLLFPFLLFISDRPFQISCLIIGSHPLSTPYAEFEGSLTPWTSGYFRSSSLTYTPRVNLEFPMNLTSYSWTVKGSWRTGRETSKHRKNIKLHTDQDPNT